MTCVEFQGALPYIIDSGGTAEQEEHLRSCPVCGDLVADLRYIAEVAKLLVPMEDPPARVWDGIERSLSKERVAARPTGPRGGLLSFPWVGTAVAILLVILGLALYHRGSANSAGERAALQSPLVKASFPTEHDDQQMLAAVAGHAPSLRSMYEENLRHVNAYISDARRELEQHPDDDDARQYLMQAYRQKTMLYQMALSRSLQ